MTARPAQLPLDLPHRPALSGDDFFVAPANQAAIDWIDRWPDWPGPGLIIHGAPGCGKSHLAQVFAAKTGARLIAAHELTTAIVADTVGVAPAYVIDDADRIVSGSDAAAENLFHLYNRARGDNIKLLLSAAAPASHWELALPDLASRLRAMDQIAIEAPDDTLLGVLLAKQFSDRQLRVDPDVIAYLTPRMERSTAAAARLVEAIDRESLSRKQAITVPLARTVLDRIEQVRQDDLDL